MIIKDIVTYSCSKCNFTLTALEIIQEHRKSNHEKVKKLLPTNHVSKTTNLAIVVVIRQHDCQT